MILSLVLVVAGMAMLTFAADKFVHGSARLALGLRVSAVVVGAVVVGFGTSAPELLVSIVAASRDDLDLGVGNAIGSNVANLSLVLGVAALITPVTVQSRSLRREAPLSILAAVLFALLVRDGLSRLDGLILATALVIILVYLVLTARGEGPTFDDDMAELLDERERIELGREAFRLLVGLAGVVIGAQLVVEGAHDIAVRAGISSGFIGLTLVAVGTSLPELVTAVAAARHDHTDLIVGTLLGSNVFNALAIGGAMGLVGPGPLVDDNLASFALIVMLAVAVVGVAFMQTGRKVVRWEAGVLLGVYAVSVPLLA